MVRLISRITDLREIGDPPRRKGMKPKGKDRRYSKAACRPSAYDNRNQIIKALGYRSYKDYLRSGLWAEIRARVLSDRPLCAICQEHAPSQVHHEYYSQENLSGQALGGLIPLCWKCHKQIEFYSNGNKRSLTAAAKALYRLLKRPKRPKKSDGVPLSP